MKLYRADNCNYMLENFDDFDKDYSYNIASVVNYFQGDNLAIFRVNESNYYDKRYCIDRDFIKNRILFKERYPTNESPYYIWYYAKDICELTKVIEKVWQFNCTIIPVNKSLNDYLFMLRFIEGLDSNSLCITTTCSVFFLKEVLPKLEVFYNEKIEIIDVTEDDLD